MLNNRIDSMEIAFPVRFSLAFLWPSMPEYTHIEIKRLWVLILCRHTRTYFGK